MLSLKHVPVVTTITFVILVFGVEKKFNFSLYFEPYCRRCMRWGGGARMAEWAAAPSPRNSGNLCMVRKWGINSHGESIEEWTPTSGPKSGQNASSAPPNGKRPYASAY